MLVQRRGDTAAPQAMKKPGAVSRPGANHQFQFHEYISKVAAVNPGINHSCDRLFADLKML
jgi:hypothetical protein